MTATRKDLFRSMLYIRLVEERIADEYAHQEMRCPVHFSIGQEAVSAGVCAALTPNDKVMSNHRCHGHYLAKGGNLNAMIAEFYGKATGCASGKGGSMHLVDLDCGFLGAAPIVASTISIGGGTAFAAKQRGESRVSVVFFGEGAVETGGFYESVNFAVLHQLPVLFVCENNLYSVYSPLSVRQPEGREICDLASGIGISSQKGDGNDVDEVYQLTRTAVDAIRRGDGPALLEFSTYRWREHCGPNYDNDLGYRSTAEFEEWRAHCPVERTRKSLEAKNAISEIEIAAMRAEINTAVDAAFAFAKNSPYPEPDDAYTAIYAS